MGGGRGPAWRADTSRADPQARDPHGPLLSVAKLLVVLADFMLAHATVWRRARARGALILERGWQDMAVDPRRYRLHPSVRRLVRVLGRLLPRPDIALVLTGDAEVLAHRKPELAWEEIARQSEEWRRVGHRLGVRTMLVDSTTATPEDTVERVVAGLCDANQLPWRAVPMTPARLELRFRGDSTALQFYRAYLLRTRIASTLGRAMSRFGLAPRVEPPFDRADEIARRVVGSCDGLAAMRSSVNNRWVLACSRQRHLDAIVKVGDRGDTGLHREAEVISELGAVTTPFRVPGVLHADSYGDHFVLATEAVEAHPAEASIDAIVAICTALVRGPDGGEPRVHGDLAPWNVLVTADGPVVVDWENSFQGSHPLFDLAHYLIRCGALLNRYSPRRAFELMTLPDSPGVTHLRAVGVEPTRATALLRTYLKETDRATTDVREIGFRRRLQSLVDQ